ncbi:MAG: AMP-binding protein, partial [Pseudomonadota bacterium]
MNNLTQHRIHATTVADLLLTTADRFPDRPLLIFPDRRKTYQEMVDASYKHACSLYALGIRSGDHVGILMANCIEYMELVLGACMLGAVAVPVNA